MGWGPVKKQYVHAMSINTKTTKTIGAFRIITLKNVELSYLLKMILRFNAGAGKFGAAYAQVSNLDLYFKMMRNEV